MFKNLLAQSQVYDWVQRAFGADRYRRFVVEELLRLSPGQCVLDLGCGTGAILSKLIDIDYVGIDASRNYIQAAIKRHPNRGCFIESDVEQPIPIDKKFDAIIALGVLHHLNDSQVQSLMKTAEHHLAEGGRVITVDPCFIEGQNIIAKTLARQDRGKYVRSPIEYDLAAKKVFQNTEVSVRSDLLYVPFTHAIVIARK